MEARAGSKAGNLNWRSLRAQELEWGTDSSSGLCHAAQRALALKFSPARLSMRLWTCGQPLWACVTCRKTERRRNIFRGVKNEHAVKLTIVLVTASTYITFSRCQRPSRNVKNVSSQGLCSYFPHVPDKGTEDRDFKVLPKIARSWQNPESEPELSGSGVHTWRHWKGQEALKSKNEKHSCGVCRKMVLDESEFLLFPTPSSTLPATLPAKILD